MEYVEQKKKLLSGVGTYRGAFLAGGSVNSVFTGRKIADFDFYFKDQASFEFAVAMAYEEGNWCLHASDRSVTFSDNGTNLQFMHFEFFSDAAAVFDAFDFTICMGAYDMDAKAFVFHDQFLTDCAERKLRFHAGTRFPLISALRVLKYQERGYSLAREDMLRLALACSALEMCSWEDLERQIGGLYGDRTVVARDGEVDVFKVISAIGTEAQKKHEEAVANDDREAHYANAFTLLNYLRQAKGQPLIEDIEHVFALEAAE